MVSFSEATPSSHVGDATQFFTPLTAMRPGSSNVSTGSSTPRAQPSSPLAGYGRAVSQNQQFPPAPSSHSHHGSPAPSSRSHHSHHGSPAPSSHSHHGSPAPRSQHSSPGPFAQLHASMAVNRQSLLQNNVYGGVADLLSAPLIAFVNQQNGWQEFRGWLATHTPASVAAMMKGEEVTSHLQDVLQALAHNGHTQEGPRSASALASSASGGFSQASEALGGERLPSDLQQRLRSDGSGYEIEIVTEEQRDDVFKKRPWALLACEACYGLDQHPGYLPEPGVTYKFGFTSSLPNVEDRMIKAFALGVARNYWVRPLQGPLRLLPENFYPEVPLDIGPSDLIRDMSLYRRQMHLNSPSGCPCFDEELLILAVRLHFTGVRERNSEFGGAAWVEYLVQATLLPHFDRVVMICINRYEQSIDGGPAVTVRLFDQKKRFYWNALDNYLQLYWIKLRRRYEVEWDAALFRRLSTLTDPEAREMEKIRLEELLPPFHPRYRPRPAEYTLDASC
ncbi:hypothetical protein BJ508DRAFT_312879 [Ascobolus immersus RN42]|uniref:Uncharacterized protein n=1 Tax=Ascobolus immersus RN42 TaxID=1160509 RepID=A0A3N4HKR1_ASCIM|nr:hypothetical protein BJ508DRAFT_312879 [Ascobolus immersus RN42]